MDITLTVSVAKQRLYCFKGKQLQQTFVISTSASGVGEQWGSEKTPRGLHCIRACIGAGQPINTIFVARRPTGERYSPDLALKHPNKDWILTRILWLSGKEIGKNRLGLVDTFRRFIYIHGCPDEYPLGTPASHGCIRMANTDILTLFDCVCPGTLVTIL